ncbi:hypothetical protein [Streptomyces cucumeris]|uniref:hypothetical protein n=1 Tax=Streptomyces cucumeris TaxID=2962890 RepID=UPI003EBA305C
MSNGPAWLAASAGVAGAGAAWFAAVNGVRTLSQTRKDSKGRSRPMVAAEFRDAWPSEGTLYLVIRNYGPSVAKNVAIAFEPEIPDPEPEEEHQSVIPFLKNRYRGKIATLTPGTELKNLWFVGEEQGRGEFVNVEPTPDHVVVKIDYESTEGDKYSDSFELSVDVMRGETRVTSSRSLESKAKEISQTLRAIQKSMSSLERKIPKR